jgi:replication initiation protein RepC
MLDARDEADRFAGLPRGTAKPLRFLAGFQEAEPYLGLPVHAFKLVAWLVKQTQAQDWEEGSRPIAWPSARRQEEFLGLSPARVKRLNRALFEAGIFVIRDNEQGRRYGRRGPDGRIIEAYGFDLTPLAQRYDEFVRIAAEARLERERMKDLRRRATIARRAVRQAGEELAVLGQVPDDWARLRAETDGLIAAGRGARGSEALAIVVQGLERRKIEAEQWLRDIPKAVDTSPTGLENEPHTTSTNLTQNLAQDTVIAQREEGRSGPAEPPSPPPVPRAPAEKELRLKPTQLLDLAPRLRQCVLTENPGWPDLVDAAGSYLRHELGVSMPLWGEACRVMGRDYATVALAIVSTKPEGHFSKGAGGYFGGMVRKAEKGELHLDRTLWALREAKWGKPERRRGLN